MENVFVCNAKCLQFWRAPKGNNILNNNEQSLLIVRSMAYQVRSMVYQVGTLRAACSIYITVQTAS